MTTQTKTKTYLSFLLDRSGSMNVVKDATISGFNEYLTNQQSQDGELTVSLTLFDYDEDRSQINTIVDRIPGDQVIPLNDQSYVPRGMTPLYDAVGHVLTRAIEHTTGDGDWKIGRHSDTYQGGQSYDTKVFVIMTDGLENASTEWEVDQVRKLIEGIENDGWQVVFLGANQDAWASAANIGSQSGTYVTYGNTAGSVAAATRTASHVTSSYRNTGQAMAATFDVTSGQVPDIANETSDDESE